MHIIRVTEVGWRARRLVEGTSTAAVVAALSRSVYMDVAGEIVWLGPRGATLHGRTIVADELPALDEGARVETAFDLRAAREWRPAAAPAGISIDTMRREARRLTAAIERVGRGDGFGPLLVGHRPVFPLERAAEDARGFLAACADDEPAGALAIAERLLGLGPGLTPAGDDLIGGALFTKACGVITGPSWRAAAETIRQLARERTHRISAMLLGDLLDGEGHAPLHDLIVALATADPRAAEDAAARLVRIGHSSGWDMLTGVLGALGALPAR
jgi:hypothetical protein